MRALRTKVSIHAPREGCDNLQRMVSLLEERFNSRTPGGVRLDGTTLHVHPPGVSIHAPREGCDGRAPTGRDYPTVSIHAPREGCDFVCTTTSRLLSSFNSRTPGGVRRLLTPYKVNFETFQFTHPGRGATIHQRANPDHLVWFQFTHPGRGATTGAAPPTYCSSCFNSRTPGGVRHLPLCLFAGQPGVSIHAPREGCDMRVGGSHRRYDKFQFTHPGRGATSTPRAVSSSSQSFNSRTPGGVRRPSSERRSSAEAFQFTHPGRGATRDKQGRSTWPAFQFTHPGRGATPSSRPHWGQAFGFNSRTPGGVRLGGLIKVQELTKFQFTHPGRGATVLETHERGRALVSIHAPREGCDLLAVNILPTEDVSIHAPREGCDIIGPPTRDI